MESLSLSQCALTKTMPLSPPSYEAAYSEIALPVFAHCL